jgi:DNA-binding NarL/FixJ family response regulator
MAPAESPRDLLDERTWNVLIVDDAASTRLILRSVIDAISCLHVAGEAATAEAALDSAAVLDPDVILLDLSLPDTSGAAILSDLSLRAPNARVVILSNNSRAAGPDLVAAGAAGYIEKGLPPKALVERLSVILKRTLTLSSALPDL